MTYAFNVPTVPQMVVQFEKTPTTDCLDALADVINYHYKQPAGVSMFTGYIKAMVDAGDKLENEDIIIDLLDLILKVASYNRDYAFRMSMKEKKEQNRKVEETSSRLGLPQAGDDDLPF